MKGRNSLFIVSMASAASLMMFFSGCVNNGASFNDTNENSFVLNEDVPSDENVLDIENDSLNTTDAGNVNAKNDIPEVTTEPDNSYIFEELCKVNDTYSEIEFQAPIAEVVELLRKDSYNRMILVEHTVEEEDGKYKDNITYKIEPKNPSGMARQLVTCNAVLEKTEDKWQIVSKEWVEWDIKNSRLNGCSMYLENNSLDSLKGCFENVSSDDEGEIYIRFRKNVDYLGAVKGDDRSVYETKIGTNFSGSIYLVNGDKKEEAEFKCMEGFTDDEGNFSLKLVTDNGEGNLTLDEGCKCISKGSLEAAVSEEEKAVDEDFGFDKFDTFEVTSDSLVYGEWKKECGSNNGNLSPELSWEGDENASEYIIVMVDLDDVDSHVHWYAATDKKSFNAGDFTRDNGFVGPYPPSSHEYSVYVFALKDEPKEFCIEADTLGGSVQRIAELIEKDTPGNILSYGVLSGSYEYITRVW